MSQINFRPATLLDIPTLRRFEQGVIAAERPFDITLKSDPIHYYNIEELINSEHSELVVAELHGKLIASGYARIEDSKHYLVHRKHAYCGFMYVVPEHRGKGLNKEILKILKIWALSGGITELRLDVYEDNLPAINAYQRAGFTKYLAHMRMDISKEMPGSDTGINF